MQKPIKLFFTILLFFSSLITFSQVKLPYQIFDKNGKVVSYPIVIKQLEKSSIVLFGEYHDNSIIHWLQLEITKELSLKKSLILGAEMIEADNQKQLNQYLLGEINQKKLDSTARLWPNYKTDYKPLVDFAKANAIPFIATNVPRRFASLVFKQGFTALDQLSDQEKLWVATLPINYNPMLPGYVKMVEEMGGHGGENLPKAQAVKDATMAHFILLNGKEDSLFIHFNGTYHSDNFDGIYWYLKQAQPKKVVRTIATVTQENIAVLEKENYNKADFIIVVDQDATKTY